MEIQSVLIPKKNFTMKQAVAWLNSKKMKTTFAGKKVDITDKYFRFRQRQPKKTARYFVRHVENGILYVVMY